MVMLPRVAVDNLITAVFEACDFEPSAEEMDRPPTRAGVSRTLRRSMVRFASAGSQPLCPQAGRVYR